MNYKKEILRRSTHKGAQCPACKYVYTNGLFDITEAVSTENPNEPVAGHVTVCTRCLRTLSVEKDGLRLLNDIEIMLLTPQQLEAIKTMKALARFHTHDQS